MGIAMPGNFNASRQTWSHKGNEMHPWIWMGRDSNRPACCNVQGIDVDCSAKSPLRWGDAHRMAHHLSEKGILIMWNLQTGLFDGGVSTPGEGALNAALRAFAFFQETLYPHFAEWTLCAIVDKVIPREWAMTGASTPTLVRDEPVCHDSLSFDRSTIFERFERACEIWRSLSAALSEDCPIGVLLDLRALSPALQLQLTHQERLEHLLPFVDSNLKSLGALTWNRPSFQGAIWAQKELAPSTATVSRGELALALGVPIRECRDALCWERLGRSIELLEDLGISHRTISLRCLRDHWQGLDEIIAYTQGMTHLERRQLEGFCAAGGRVVGLGQEQLFENQISFGKWVVEKMANGLDDTFAKSEGIARA